MSTLKNDAMGDEATRLFDRPPEARVVGEVLARLGMPERLHEIKVKMVAAGKYRVNVYVQAGTGTYRVAHSFFVETDPSGALLSSSPAIVRAYP